MLIWLYNFPGEDHLNQLEKNVLDVVGRESARVRAVQTADMQVGPKTSASNATLPNFEQQIVDATIIFEEDTGSGKFSYKY